MVEEGWLCEPGVAIWGEVGSANLVVFLGGLGDTLDSIGYVPALKAVLKKLNWSFVHLLPRSAGPNYGLYRLGHDSQDILSGLRFLQAKYSLKNIVLLGHSTGCQDILHTDLPSLVKGIILQAPVSDRQGLSDPHICELMPVAIREPQRLFKLDDLLISGERLYSLYGIGGADDMFSSDLNEYPYLAQIALPTLILYSDQDEYVPQSVNKVALLEKWSQINPNLSCHLIQGMHSPSISELDCLITNFLIKHFS